jgi:hypothetical protein
MELKHIDISRLSVSGLTMRGARKLPDIAHILPSVRARAVLVPLIVRALEGSAPDEEGNPFYEIIAGNARQPAKVQRAILRDRLLGTNGRRKVEQWVPRWMQFLSEPMGQAA